MTKGNIQFSAKLLPLLSATDNSVISPHGIASVLAMATEGADKDSIAEILRCMGFNRIDELRASVLAATANQSNAFKSENTVILTKADDNAKLLEEFKQTMAEKFFADIIEKASDESSSVSFQNIADFKAEWLYTMVRDALNDKYFCNADGSQCRPLFLSCTEKLRYYCNDKSGTKAVALPYKSGGKAIPFELVLVDSDNHLSEGIITEIFNNMKKGECEVEFPEFSVKNEFDLIPMMKALGLKAIFDEKQAPFTRITTIPMYSNAFGQKARIQADEHGTIAKAFTFMLCQAVSCITPQKTKLVFNKPFTFFLRNTNTKDILFMGKINKC